MHGTRERILELIIEQREARVETLADELGITGAAVRRHLDHLRADGLVDVKQVKQATGRPFHAYHATEAATGVMPAAYADLLARMLRGLSGEGVQSEVMASVAESMASRHRGGMPADGGDPAVLVGTVTDALRGEGILDAWRSEADGFHLTNTACPYRQAAEISALPCESDRKAIELLLGLDVQQVHRIVDGSTCCEYLVHPAGGPQLIQIA